MSALRLAIIPVLGILSMCGCGYRVGGKAEMMPANIHTIAVPAFANTSMRYRLTERLPAAITREFLSRTRYRVVPDPRNADAVLEGRVASYNSYPTIYDSNTQRASAVQINVTIGVTLRDRTTGKVIFSRDRLDIKERYEISVEQTAYFEESDSALERLSHDVARTVVSAILEKF